MSVGESCVPCVSMHIGEKEKTYKIEKVAEIQLPIPSSQKDNDIYRLDRYTYVPRKIVFRLTLLYVHDRLLCLCTNW